MVRRQLTLVFSSSRPNVMRSKIDSIKLKPLRASYSTSSAVATKLARLHTVNPAAAKLLERLLDDALNGGPTPTFQRE